MIILNLILPLNLMILMFVLFVQVWYLQSEVKSDDIQAKRYLAGPLKDVFSDKPEQEKDIPGWIVLVTLEDGRIYYPFEDIERLIVEWGLPAEDKLESFLALMAQHVQTEMSQVSFFYKGQKGLCFYLDDQLPSAFKVLQKPRYLINLFLVTTLFFLLGAGIMYNLKRNMKELILAAKRFSEFDFTTPIVSRKDNELSDVFIAFENMRKELKSSREQAILFMMSLSHDLKTPLTSIRGYLEAFRDGVIESPEEQTQAIDVLLKKSGLLDERINELLGFAQDVSAQAYCLKEDIAVKFWVSELQQYCREESDLFSKKFSFSDTCPDNLYLSGTEKRLTRAIHNLYDNANRYTSKGEIIRLSCGFDGKASQLILRMDDSGPGVKEEDRERVFELFFRKDRGRNTRGMGIGLASVKFVSEIHGGTVECRPSDLGGACFEVRLPVVFSDFSESDQSGSQNLIES